MVVSRDGLDLHDVFSDAEDLSQISGAFPILLSSKPCCFVNFQDHFLTVRSRQVVDLTQDSCALTQHQYATSPSEIIDALCSYWLPIWTKSISSLQFQSLTSQELGFQDFLQHIPETPEILVSMQDPDLWHAAITKLKSSSARGTDGISAQELKLLPPPAIEALALLLGQDGFRFDPGQISGLIAPLSKANNSIPCKGQTRPITILPQLYRLWASVACSQIALAFSSWAPREITGFLPHRGSGQSALASQFDLEHARWKQQYRTGLVLDFTKCFNTIAWDFGYHALRSCGVPVTLLDVWMHAQQNLVRYWLLNGEIFQISKASGGFPEGDQ